MEINVHMIQIEKLDEKYKCVLTFVQNNRKRFRIKK